MISLPYCHKYLRFTENSTLVVAMAMSTRSGASPATPAVANKATKTTPARNANKAESKCLSRPIPNKANTTNRVQKPASGRSARGYARVNETTGNDTSRSASPDFIPATLPLSHHVIQKTPPLSVQARLEAEIAHLRRKLQGKVADPLSWKWRAQVIGGLVVEMYVAPDQSEPSLLMVHHAERHSSPCILVEDQVWLCSLRRAAVRIVSSTCVNRARDQLPG